LSGACTCALDAQCPLGFVCTFGICTLH
jgi:hypothetical protein